jgi:hypothetical protein
MRLVGKRFLKLGKRAPPRHRLFVSAIPWSPEWLTLQPEFAVPRHTPGIGLTAQRLNVSWIVKRF